MSDIPEQIKKIKELVVSADFNQLKPALAALNLEQFSIQQICELADILTLARLFVEARPVWQKAVQKAPHIAELRNNFGLVLLNLGDAPAAKTELSEALKLKPDFASALFNLGKVYQQLSDPLRALDAFDRAIKAGVSEPEVFCRYGSVLIALTRFKEAIVIFEKALSRYPTNFDLRHLLAIAYVKADNYKKAVDLLRELVKEPKPDGSLFNLLGLSLNKTGNLSEAQECFKRAATDARLELMARANLGNCLVFQGRIEEGISELQAVVKLKPEEIKSCSMLCMSANYDHRLSNQQLWELHNSFNSRFVPAPKLWPKKHPKIKIAYLSADLKLHSVAYFMKALFEFRDRDRFEIMVFSDLKYADSVSTWFKSKSDLWIDSLVLKNSDLVRSVREHEADIAFDLAGHTEGSRLACFAERLAPVQVSYLGYPNTSGLESMDYRLTDAFCDPAQSDPFYSEKLIRLDPGFLCYSVLKQAPDVSKSAFIANKFITFASFNTLAKINMQVISLWARILQAVPASRLLLKAPGLEDPECRQRIEKEFLKHGVIAARLIMLPHISDWAGHMQQYLKVDIALDTFPYNGTTTTFEALFMGVPTVVLKGQRHSSRVGYSILSNSGLPELIAPDEDSYLKSAVELAENKEKLIHYRQSLRETLKNSVLMDGLSFTRKFERIISELV